MILVNIARSTIFRMFKTKIVEIFNMFATYEYVVCFTENV
jgi:hypothetical protein